MPLKSKQSRGKKCPICRKSIVNLQRHITIHDEKRHMCDICGKEWPRLADLKEHIKTHTREKIKKMCKICKKSFKPEYLKIHMEKHMVNGERKYKCDICDKTFMHKLYLEHHTRVHTGENSKNCPICGKNVNGRSFREHLRIHSGVRKYVCEICQKAFQNKSNLVQHSVVHTGERAFTCKVCNKQYSSKGNLKYHMSNVHTDGQAYPCSICGKEFGTLNLRKAHEGRHGDYEHKCGICHMTFRNRKYFINHTKTHTNEHHCYKCDKGFKSKIVLEQHMEGHKRKDKFCEYICRLCGECFHLSAALYDHRKKHLPVAENYVCIPCNIKFRKPELLKEHQQLHSLERQFACHICTCRFVTDRLLRLHFVKHTKDGTYKCDHCNISFKSENILRKHMKCHF